MLSFPLAFSARFRDSSSYCKFSSQSTLFILIVYSYITYSKGPPHFKKLEAVLHILVLCPGLLPFSCLAGFYFFYNCHLSTRRPGVSSFFVYIFTIYGGL